MCRDAERWVFTLPVEFRWESGLASPQDLAFHDKTGVVRLIVRRTGEVEIPSAYAWDGCSPKFCVFDLVVGTPDGVVDSRTKQRKTYYASLVHDAMYQFLLDGLPYTRRQVDGCFRRLMAATGFDLRWVYWAAVRTFGWFFVGLHRYKRKNRGYAEILSPAS
jgi:Protein of unknown function (DUF1353)